MGCLAEPARILSSLEAMEVECVERPKCNDDKLVEGGAIARTATSRQASQELQDGMKEVFIRDWVGKLRLLSCQPTCIARHDPRTINPLTTLEVVPSIFQSYPARFWNSLGTKSVPHQLTYYFVPSQVHALSIVPPLRSTVPERVHGCKTTATVCIACCKFDRMQNRSES